MIVLFFLSGCQFKEEEDNKRPVRNLSYLPGSFSFLPNKFLENSIKNNKNTVKLESNPNLQSGPTRFLQTPKLESAMKRASCRF